MLRCVATRCSKRRRRRTKSVEIVARHTRILTLEKSGRTVLLNIVPYQHSILHIILQAYVSLQCTKYCVASVLRSSIFVFSLLYFPWPDSDSDPTGDRWTLLPFYEVYLYRMCGIPYLPTVLCTTVQHTVGRKRCHYRT